MTLHSVLHGTLLTESGPWYPCTGIMKPCKGKKETSTNTLLKDNYLWPSQDMPAAQALIGHPAISNDP